jgi:hypothetical protein
VNREEKVLDAMRRLHPMLGVEDMEHIVEVVKAARAQELKSHNLSKALANLDGEEEA